MSNIQANPKIALNKKIAALRVLINKQDWVNDKMVRMAQNSYGYLSVDKIKKTMAPLFVEVGLDFQPDVEEITRYTDLGKNHWVVKMKTKLIDIDTDEFTETTTFGESMDNNDKGLAKAQTYALKAFFTQKFVLADGIDPDSVGGDKENFKPKSPEELEEIRSKIKAKGVPPEAKEVSAPKAPAPVSVEAPKTVKAPKASKTVKAPSEPKFDNMPAPPEPSKPEPKKDGELFTPSGPLNAAVQNIVDGLTQKAKDGAITPEVYNEMSMARASMTSDTEAASFIKKYRGM